MSVRRISPLVIILVVCLTFVGNGHADVVTVGSKGTEIRGCHYMNVRCGPIMGVTEDRGDKVSLCDISARAPACDSDVGSFIDSQNPDAGKFRIYPCRAYCSFYGRTLQYDVISYIDLRLPYSKRLDVESAFLGNSVTGSRMGDGGFFAVASISVITVFMMAGTLVGTLIMTLWFKIEVVLAELTWD